VSDKLLSRTDRLVLATESLRTLGYNQFCTNEQISDWSGGYQPGTQEFNFFVSNVRQLLVQRGMWLSGEGQEEKGFFVVRPSENAVVASRMKNKAERVLFNMRQLLENTPLEQLSDPEKRRHEKELREIRYTTRVLRRKSEVIAVIKKHSPGILRDDLDT
jgi:hypothetical protein